MKKLLKSKKALSPVVAAIILIAVTVAVSIAVAAWMGSLTIGFMETSELTVTQMTFNTSANTTTVYLTNSGTSDVTVTMVKINGNTVVDADIPMTSAIEAGDSTTLTLDYASGNGIVSGGKYSISLFTSDGTLVGQFQDTA
jgi:flagellin-like protein